MLISERESARRLAVHGRSLSAAQHLLSTGIAGTPLRTAVATLYDEERVDALVGRGHVDAHTFAEAFPHGVVVARLPRSRAFDVAAPWADRAQAMAGPWRIPVRKAMLLAVTVGLRPGYPLLLSVGGHVVDGGRIQRCLGAPDRAGTLVDLVPPGEWIEELSGRRLRGHRGPQVELVGWVPSAVRGHGS